VKAALFTIDDCRVPIGGSRQILNRKSVNLQSAIGDRFTAEYTPNDE